jgi:hypothetical protein
VGRPLSSSEVSQKGGLPFEVRDREDTPKSIECRAFEEVLYIVIVALGNLIINKGLFFYIYCVLQSYYDKAASISTRLPPQKTRSSIGGIPRGLFARLPPQKTRSSIGRIPRELSTRLPPQKTWSSIEGIPRGLSARLPPQKTRSSIGGIPMELSTRFRPQKNWSSIRGIPNGLSTQLPPQKTQSSIGGIPRVPDYSSKLKVVAQQKIWIKIRIKIWI